MCEHIAASFFREKEETRLRQYITEALRILTENTTHFLIPGVGDVNYGTYIQKPWLDLSAGRGQKPKPTKTADEIADEVIRRAGLTIKEGTSDG